MGRRQRIPFTNTFFHLRAQESENKALLERIQKNHGTLSKKIDELIDFATKLPDHNALIERIYGLVQLRHEIVHPRWVPSSVQMGGSAPVIINGLVENRQAMFEDDAFCREALCWCLLVIGYIGQARGIKNDEGHLFHWTGNYGLTVEQLERELGISVSP